MAIYIFALYMLTSAMKGSSMYAAGLGTFSAGVEALLAVPQFYRNCVKRSTEGLTIVLVLLWAVGDTAKIIYNAMNEEPIQLVVGAVFQLLVDILILIQFVFYGNVKPPRSKEQ
eukprot:TRINITY_DN3317_c0_g2_i2.p3 TRINITY_DN3317_c0_g2~~TRINITY_DN3317_c0_g2_i2.p3  ORF type:complete len:114 (+),score=20.63 TRINITY_DN3317_c0_g2_i2:502-843(+)